MASRRDGAPFAEHDMLSGTRVSVLIPCLNEAEKLPYVLRRFGLDSRSRDDR